MLKLISKDKIKYYLIEFKWQAGLAITLPILWSIFVFPKDKEKYLNNIQKTRKHEETHVRQIKNLGGLRYLWLHIYQRIKYELLGGHPEGFLYGFDTPLEQEAYKEQEE